MKRIVLVSLGLAAALAAVTTAVAVAQTPQPPVPGNGGPGFGGWMGRMHSFAATGEVGPMHEYMQQALADALGITLEQFETRLAAGDTPYEIALSQGFSANEVPTLLRDAHTEALDAAAAAGVITQEQADWMKSRSSRMGTGNCAGAGQRPGGMMGGWRFQQTNP